MQGLSQGGAGGISISRYNDCSAAHLPEGGGGGRDTEGRAERPRALQPFTLVGSGLEG